MSRRTRTGLLVLLTAAVVLLVGAAPASAAPSVLAGCGSIDAPGAYVLDGDVAGGGNATCIAVTADDVVLDGNGHSITGSDAGNSVGIHVNGSSGTRLTNVTVRNLTVSDWDTGLYYDASDDGTIRNVTATSNGDYGIHVLSATNVAVIDVNTADHSGYNDAGLRIGSSTGVSVSRYVGTGNEFGVHVFGGSGHVVTDSTFTDDYGVRVDDAQGVQIRDNAFEDAGAAVYIRNSGDVRVEGNAIVDGSMGSISGTNGPANRVTNNAIYESSRYATGADCGGMSISGAADDIVANNTWTECNWGVSIADSVRVEFRNNTISGTDGGNNDWGLRVSGGEGHQITDNTIVDNGKYPKRAGILLGTHRATLSGNTLAGNGFNLEIGTGGNWSSISHTIDATNTVEGRPVAYHVNETDVTVDPAAGWVGLVGTQNATVADMDFAANNRENVLLRYADDTTIRNVTMTPSWVGIQTWDGSDRTEIVDSHLDGGRGISINEASGTTIVDTAVTNSRGYGVYLSEAPGSTFENVTVTGSSRRGIGVRNGESVTVEVTVANSTVSGNGWGGIDLYRAARSTVRDSVVENNGGSGVQFQRYGHNVTITGNRIADNDGDGVTFSQYPADNLIAGNTITGNAGTGVVLGYDSTRETVRGNVLTGNAVGLGLPTSGRYLAVYDNRFNNTRNVDVPDPAGVTNASWNTTVTPGTNVIGGSTIAGNLWANASGTGFSETCPDGDADGLCDDPYEVAGANHTDYHPLASPTPASEPDVAVSPAAVDFGDVTVGSNDTASVTVSNDGDATLSVTATTIGGPNASAYTLSNGGAFTLAPGAHRDLTVTYEPPTSGSHDATLSIDSNDTDASTVAVPLSGSGVESTATPTPTPTPTATPTPTPTPTATPTPTPTPTATPTATPPSTPTTTSTPTSTPAPTATPSGSGGSGNGGAGSGSGSSGRPTATATPSPTPTASPTATPAVTETAAPTDDPATPTGTAAATATPAETVATGTEDDGPGFGVVVALVALLATVALGVRRA